MKTCIFWPSVLRIVNIVNLGQLPDAVSNISAQLFFHGSRDLLPVSSQRIGSWATANHNDQKRGYSDSSKSTIIKMIEAMSSTAYSSSLIPSGKAGRIMVRNIKTQ